MAGTNNSISTLLAQFLRLENNALAILGKLNEATTTSADSVVIPQTNSQGGTDNYSVPSFGWYKAELHRLDNNIQALAGLGDASAFVKMPDGTVKKIFASDPTTDPDPIRTLVTPSTFKIKNNWFFESFLNPLLYVGLDVSGQVPEDIERAVTKRLIIAANTQEEKDWFDLNYKGRNDIDYLTLLRDLNDNAIGYFVDEQIVDMPVAVMQFKGSFDVLKTFDEEITITSGISTITVKKRKYKLNKLTYTDISTGLTDSKLLKNGDVLITSDGSKYRVESLDASENTVVLTMIAGHSPITIGVGTLSIYSSPFKTKEIQVGVGHDERQVVFVKPIEPKFNVAASTFSPGTAFWTNQLTINTPDGTTDLDTFYKGNVTDFGLQFIQSAKERTIPSVYGEIPDAPILDASNFKVVQINGHITDQKEVDSIKQQLSSKAQLENEIDQIDQAINQKKNDLNNNASIKSDAEKAKIQSDLAALAAQRVSKVNLFSSVVAKIATMATQNPASSTKPIFRVRGFFPIPTAKTSAKTNPQEAVQFIIAYRKLKKDGNAPATQQIDFVDTDGNTKSGFFTNWTEVRSPLRGRAYNEVTGFYEWAVEDVSHPEKNNINQVDIPIEPGEQVEIRVKTISEAGWPINPLESDWSPSTIIDFPQDLQISADTAQLLQNAQSEDTRVKFQSELSARGLDLHLLSSFTNADKYYSHKAEDIASGFVTPEGKVINLYEKLKQMEATLQQLQQLIAKAKGTLVVYLLDDTGNITKVTQNQTVQLFAGFYKSLIQSGSGPITYDDGKIITKVYTLRVENSAASTLELASYIPGGLNEIVASTTADYVNNRMYDEVPISLSGLNTTYSGDPGQLAPYQSMQVKSLWLYGRKRSVGLDEDLYAVSGGIPSAAYNFLSPNALNGHLLLPHDPTSNAITSTTDPNVWNGTTDGSAVPNGGGYLTEFCIHKDHPVLLTGALGASWNWASGTLGPDLFGTFGTVLSGTKYQVVQNLWGGYYLPFVHSQYFSDDISVANSKQQLRAIQPTAGVIGANQYKIATSTLADMTNVPAKLGFHKNDYYLIGKYTCGAYLYLAPVAYNVDINVDGSNELAKKDLLFGEDKSINIPLVFQMRCSDKLGKVGGFRSTGDIANVTYTKKIGIDIQVRNETLFSFDVEVTGKYDQDSLVGPTYIPNVALDRLSSIRSTTQTTTQVL